MSSASVLEKNLNSHWKLLNESLKCDSTVLLLATNEHWTNKKDKEGWARLVAARLTHQSVCCSERRQSPTFVSVQHGQSLSPPPPLSLALCNLPTSLHLPSLASHAWKRAWLMPVSTASFTVRTLVALSRREDALPGNTHTHSLWHPPAPTAWARVGHWRWGTGHSCSSPAACQLEARSSRNLRKQRPIKRIYMCACSLSCFELWLEEVPGLQPLAQGLPVSPVK